MSESLKPISKRDEFFVRQDRIEADPERIKLKINESTLAPVINFSTFGLAIESTSTMDNELFDVTLEVDDYPVHTLNLKKIRESQKTGNWLTAFAVVGNPIEPEIINAVLQLNTLLKTRTQKFADEKTLNPTFRLKVLEVKEILTKIQHDISQLEKDSFEAERNQVDLYEDNIAVRVSNYLSKILSPIYKEFESIMTDISSKDLNNHMNYFRESVGDIMFQSAYAHRAFFKPRGYAGDYEMMNHVYKREIRGRTLFAKCLQRYFVDEPAGRAVRNREIYLRQKINMVVADNQKQNKIKILSVASGPAMEIQNFIKTFNGDLSNVEFHLLDQDIDALKHAQRRILSISHEARKEVNLVLHHKTIKSVIAEGLPEVGFSLIYSAGLFDYFTDPVAVFAAKKIYDGLTSKGSLIIGNFSLENPNKFAMGLIMDWKLIYRSRSQMAELFKSICSTVSVEEEEQSINLFAILRR